MKQIRVRFCLLVVVLASLTGFAPSAFAHAHPKIMVPAPDSSGPAPGKISITFSEAVEPKFSSIKLTEIGICLTQVSASCSVLARGRLSARFA